jgi:hypothetical protein
VCPVRAGALDPLAQRRCRQVEIAGGGANRLAFVKHQAHGAGFELVGELAARSPLRCVGHRSGHRIPLWKDVHQTGSSPCVERHGVKQFRRQSATVERELGLLAGVFSVELRRFVLLVDMRITMPKKAEMIGMTAMLALMSV